MNTWGSDSVKHQPDSSISAGFLGDKSFDVSAAQVGTRGTMSTKSKVFIAPLVVEV